MPQDTRIILKIEHPLRWYQRPKVDHALIIMAHIALVFNWIGILNNIPPIPGFLLATILTTILQIRKSIFAMPYTHQLWQRIILTILSIIGLTVYTQTIVNTSSIENMPIWVSFGIILAVLSIYDTANCLQGRLGLRIFAPLAEAIRTRKN